MKRNLALTVILFLVQITFGYSQSKTKIELKDNWYHLNGQKFFIKAIGYEIGARPGQHPYEDEKKDDEVDLGENISESLQITRSLSSLLLKS